MNKVILHSRSALHTLFLLCGLFTVAGLAYATVGGPTYIYDFKYNPVDESVYYVSASQSGRGCPPILRKLSIRSGVSETVFSCDQGEAILAQNPSDNWHPASVMQKFDELTKNFSRLVPINLPENNVVVDLEFVRTENYSPEINEIARTRFTAHLYQNGTPISDIPMNGCSRNQPFTFAGYAVPGATDKMVILSSGKGDCFEGGYIDESLHVISGVKSVRSDTLSVFYKENGALIPSEETLVVFEKGSGNINSVTVSKNENAVVSQGDEQGILLNGYTQIVIFFGAAILFTLLGVALGRTAFRKRGMSTESQRGVLDSSKPDDRQSRIGVLFVIILAVVICGVGFFGYRYFSKQKQFCWPYCKDMTDRDREDIKKQMGDATTADWKTYRNEKYGFEFKYPIDWIIREIADASGMNEPWRSFDFYSSYTDPRRSQDHAGFVAVSKKSVEELKKDLSIARESFFVKDAHTYVVTEGQVGSTFRFTNPLRSD